MKIRCQLDVYLATDAFSHRTTHSDNGFVFCADDHLCSHTPWVKEDPPSGLAVTLGIPNESLTKNTNNIQSYQQEGTVRIKKGGKVYKRN